MTRSTTRAHALTLALLLALGATATASERNDEAQGPSVSGVVSDVSGSTFKLLGGLVTVDANGAIVVSERDNRPLVLADVKIGSLVEVSGIPKSDGTIVASTIRVHGPKSDGELKGNVEGVNLQARSFSVFGSRVTWTAATIFESGAATDLTVGKAVDVEVSVFQGALVATRVSFDGGDVQSEN